MTESSSAFGSSSSSGGNLFGAGSNKGATDKSEESEESGNNSAQDASAADGAADPSAQDPFASADVEGEGEENETAQHTSHGKLLRFSDSKWASLGVGAFKIKQNKDTNKTRVLFRFEATKKVGANFNIFANMKLTRQKANMTFAGLDGDKMAMYCVKFASPEKMNEAADALEQAINDVKA